MGAWSGFLKLQFVFFWNFETLNRSIWLDWTVRAGGRYLLLLCLRVALTIPETGCLKMCGSCARNYIMILIQ